MVAGLITAHNPILAWCSSPQFEITDQLNSSLNKRTIVIIRLESKLLWLNSGTIIMERLRQVYR
jgi:hypothetical protein